MCMCTGKTEWLLLFVTQHTRKSIGSKEAVFHRVRPCPCRCFACVPQSHRWPLWLLCAFLVHHSTSTHSSPLFFFFNLRFFMSIHVCFSSFVQIVLFFFASPISNHANNCTCFCDISKFTDQFFFLWSLLCFSTIFVGFYFVFDFSF